MKSKHTRYCGDVKIEIVVKDHIDCANCQLYTKENEYINTYNISTKICVNNGYAIDSNFAIRDYCQASLSFFEYDIEHGEFEDFDMIDYELDYDKCDYYIRKEKEYTSIDLVNLYGKFYSW